MIDPRFSVELSRRRFLHTGGIGLVTLMTGVLSGCSGGSGGISDSGSPAADPDPVVVPPVVTPPVVTPPATTPPATTPPATTPPATTPPASTRGVPEPLVLGTTSGTLAKSGDYDSVFFTLDRDTYLFLDAAPQYKATAAVVTEASFNNFKNGGTYQQYLILDNQFGFVGGTVPAGNYYAAIRSNASGPSQYSLEISAITVTNPASWDLDQSQTIAVQPGGRAWMPITVRDGFTTFVNGANSGLNTDIIPASELDNFRAGRTYQRFTDYANDSQGKGYPLHWILDNLSAGLYYAAAFNPGTVVQSLDQWTTSWQSDLSRRVQSARAALIPSTQLVPKRQNVW